MYILDPNETKYTLDYYIRKAKELEAMGCIVDDDLETALKDADAINILRIQL